MCDRGQGISKVGGVMKYRKYMYKPVMITFLDHALMESPCVCKAMGWLSKEDNDSVQLCYWDLISDDRELRKANNEFFSVVKSAIRDVRLLK